MSRLLCEGLCIRPCLHVWYFSNDCRRKRLWANNSQNVFIHTSISVTPTTLRWPGAIPTSILRAILYVLSDSVHGGPNANHRRFLIWHHTLCHVQPCAMTFLGQDLLPSYPQTLTLSTSNACPLVISTVNSHPRYLKHLSDICKYKCQEG